MVGLELAHSLLGVSESRELLVALGWFIDNHLGEVRYLFVLGSGRPESLVACHQNGELFAVASDSQEVVLGVEVEVHDDALELDLEFLDFLLLVHDGVIDSELTIDAAHHEVLPIGRQFAEYVLLLDLTVVLLVYFEVVAVVFVQDDTFDSVISTGDIYFQVVSDYVVDALLVISDL